MIAAVATSEIPNRKKYAQECINLVQIMRNSGIDIPEWIMVDMEEKAKALMIEIDQEDLARAKAAEGGTLEQEMDEIKPSSDEQTKDDTEGNSSDESSHRSFLSEALHRNPEDTEINKFGIEGMYGTASTSKVSEDTASGKNNHVSFATRNSCAYSTTRKWIANSDLAEKLDDKESDAASKGMS